MSFSDPNVNLSPNFGAAAFQSPALEIHCDDKISGSSYCENRPAQMRRWLIVLPKAFHYLVFFVVCAI
jgi:hypothetical protein